MLFISFYIHYKCKHTNMIPSPLFALKYEIFIQRQSQIASLCDHKSVQSWIGASHKSCRPLRWRHNGRDSVCNHQPQDGILNRLFRRRSKKTSKRRVTGLCVGNSPGTGEFPAQMASNAENVSIWWRHHAQCGRRKWHVSIRYPCRRPECTLLSPSNIATALVG